MKIFFLDSVKVMHRAAQMAREIAIQTNTAIVVQKDGKMVFISADELRKQKQKSNPPL
ncbi:MAG TPA: hypothetical protein VIZ65_01010 [Cellvibrionaceae bacterium]